MPKKLDRDTYEWALGHLKMEGDSDLFPAPFEIESFKFNSDRLLDELEKLDITNYEWTSGRRFVVPKEEFAFRNATQLDPVDSLVIAAIIRHIGQKIEDNRIRKSNRVVFSYRFNPQDDGRFYGDQTGWHDFWDHSLSKCKNTTSNFVLTADISDFYNQIYHHTLGNELRDAGVKEQIVRVIEQNFLGSLTHGVSRGVPIGPHSVHLLAECSLNPVDQSLLSRGHDFCRYVDDFHFFCRSENQARMALYDFAEVLDKQQRLTPQKQKMEIMAVSDFMSLAEAMLIDRPLNDEEETIINIIRKHSDGDPYATVNLGDLDDDELEAVDKDTLTDLIGMYLSKSDRNYPRIGWLLRRLSQVGAPGAIDFCLRHIRDLMPVLGDVARYIMRASRNYEGDLETSGELIINALDEPVIKKNEYIQVVLVNLFSRVPGLNHINKLTSKYSGMSPSLKREIVLAAKAAGRSHWIKERKDEFDSSDVWLRRAILRAAPELPGDESRHWLKKIKRGLSSQEKLIVWDSFNSRDLSLYGFNLNS